MKVILSIKPEFADKILDGTKKFEFRKAGFSNPRITSALIYATKPVGKVVGEFEIDSVHVGCPKKIWSKTKNFAGIGKVFFDEYYRDRNVAVAIEVGKVRRFDDPVDLKSFGEKLTAPQSFCYLPQTTVEEQLPLALI
jgi:predicted transcriptional regulator